MSSASVNTVSALVWAWHPYFPACFNKMLLIIRSTVEDCCNWEWTGWEKKVLSRPKCTWHEKWDSLTSCRGSCGLRDSCLIQVLACCYILQLPVFPLSAEMRNAEGKSGNNSSSTGSCLARNLIKITNHASARNLLCPNGLSLQILSLPSTGSSRGHIRTDVTVDEGIVT